MATNQTEVTTDSTTEQELLTEVQDLQRWAAACSAKQAENRYEAKMDDEWGVAFFTGRTETYATVEEMIHEKLLPLAEKLVEEREGDDAR